MKDKGLIKNVLIIALGAVLVLGISGGAAYWAAMAVISKAGGLGTGAETVKEHKKEPTVFLTVPEVVTNLADPSGRRLIRVKIELELSDEKSKAELEKLSAPMKEAILTVLRSKAVAEVNGAEGVEALTKELLQKISPLIPNGRLIQVYITDIATQ